MCLRLTLLFLWFVELVVSRKLLYIQVITKDLKSNRILECVQMDPTENESLDAVVKEAARVSGPVKKNFFKKIVGLQKKEKKAFECLGTTIDVTKPLWMCKKVGKILDKSIRPILCHQDVSMVFVVKREKAKDHDVYGFCIDPAKFFVFHYLPDRAHCEPDERGFAKTGSGNLQTALIVQPYVPKGCVSSVLAYLEEKDFVIVPNWTRPGHVEKMTECFFKTLRSTIDYKRELRGLAGQFLARDSQYMQEARRRKMALKSPVVENPFITKEDLKTLHESVFTTVVNALSPEHRLKKYKHKLYLEPRHIDTVDQFFLAAVAEARKESASNYQPPQRKLLKIDEPNKLTVRQALRIFIISQTKYRRLLVGMLILVGRIHDTCEFMGNPNLPRRNSLSKEETLNEQCATACEFVAEFSRTLVYYKDRDIIEPACLGAVSGVCSDKICKCTLVTDKSDMANRPPTLAFCVKDITLTVKSFRMQNERRRAKMAEAKKRISRVWQKGP